MKNAKTTKYEDRKVTFVLRQVRLKASLGWMNNIDLKLETPMSLILMMKEGPIKEDLKMVVNFN